MTDPIHITPEQRERLFVQVQDSCKHKHYDDHWCWKEGEVCLCSSDTCPVLKEGGVTCE